MNLALYTNEMEWRIFMDLVQFLGVLKTSSNVDVQRFARSYNVHLSVNEIQNLRPLLDDISMHWLVTGVPDSFIEKVRRILGSRKTDALLQMYYDAKK